MITDYCTSGINELMLAAGANAFRLASPLQRFFRDMNMLRVHAYLELDSACETHGRVLQGLPPQTPVWPSEVVRDVYRGATWIVRS